jgi:lactate dehydrogenase-like 2-hydroxyacid dehydrogenase
MKVAFVDFVFEDRDAIRLDGCEFELHPPLGSPDELPAAVGDAEILMTREKTGIVTAECMDDCPNLKLIVTRTVGYDHIDLAAAKERGIVVCNVPDYGSHVIAELAFGLMLAVARNIYRGYTRYQQMRYFDDAGLGGPELFGKTLGVIGVGRVGRHSVRIGQGFGMRIMSCDIAPDEAFAAEKGFRYWPLADVLAAADFVTLHVDLNETSYHLIDAEALALFKPSAILVNTSRGDVVDTAALRAALAVGQLRGAGLDVLEDELHVYHDFGDANVVITPHIGWYAEEAVDRIMKISLANVRAWLAGDPINRLV